MSGIIGIFDRRGDRIDRATLDNMVSRMSFWGPDGVIVWQDGPIALALLKHNTTPESVGEQQPRRNGTADLVLIADARLDNREELFDIFGIPRSRQSAMTDSELIERSYERWALETPAHLIGDFAFAVWDRKRRRIFCARDHCGVRPLFYCETSGVFAFASAIKGLWGVPGISRGLDDGAIADYLVNLRAPGGGTFYQSVQRLGPGHTLSVTSDRLEISRYWALDRLADIRLKSDNEYLEAFRQTFGHAVRGRLRCIRPIGIMLSGGLDSSAVAGVAARELAARGARLHAIHAMPQPGAKFPVPYGWVADEIKYLDALREQHPNIDIHREFALGLTPLSDLEASFWRHDRPTRAANNRYWLESVLKTAQTRGIGVLLTGEFGNVTLSWHGEGTLPNLARRGRWLALAREIRAICDRREAGFWKTLRSAIIAPLLPFRARVLYSTLVKRRPPWGETSLINPEFARRSRVVDRFRARGMDPTFHPLPDTRAERRRYLADDIGEIWASSGASFGLVASDPTADKRVIEFCLAIPDDQFLRRGEPRRLVRHAMRGIVPSAILDRNDRGLQGADRFDRLGDPLAVLRDEVDRISRSELVRPYLNLALMRQLLQIASSPAFHDPDQFALSYLLQGIVLGRFLIWHGLGGPPPA
jgi:asparagine synthase (glutamine-hydrolysing)